MRINLTNIIKNYYIFFKKLLKREIFYSSVTPTQALLFITYRCTNRCSMCTIWKRGRTINKQDELTLEDWKKCIDKIASKNLEVVEIFGGDSLLRKDVTIPLIEYIIKKNKKITVDIPTNSNLIDKETADALVRIGVGRIYISLDGPIEVHNNIRGRPGTFDRVQKAIQYLVEAKKAQGKEKPYLMINCTISSSNVHNFEQIIPIVKKLGVDAIDLEYVGEFKDENIQNSDIQGFKPTPFYVNPDSSNLLSLEQAIYLKKKMKSVRELAKSLEIPLSAFNIDILTIDNLIKGTIPNKKCYFSRYTITVDPFGNVMGCFHFNNYIFGNIMKEPFSSIWKNKKHKIFLKSQKNSEIKMCENCVSGISRNLTFFQNLYRKTYIKLNSKGFDEP
jgi:MoaA/NifB/PqqE/SkfB family radical SAM enzyme